VEEAYMYIREKGEWEWGESGYTLIAGEGRVQRVRG
jgi:hypothetical protein